VIEGSVDTFGVKQKVLAPFIFAECAVTGVVYLDVLEEFLLPIFDGEGPNDRLFIKTEHLRIFRLRFRRDFVDRRFSRKWIAEAALSLCHLVLLTSHYLIFFWGPVQDTVHVPSLSTALPYLATRRRALVATSTPAIYKYVDWNKDMICAGLLTVSSLNIYKLLSAAYKNSII
jgi:hypothetical protein